MTSSIVGQRWPPGPRSRRGLLGVAAQAALAAGCGGRPGPAPWVERPAVHAGRAGSGSGASGSAAATATDDWHRVHDGRGGAAVEPERLAVLLPLSGPWAALGTELKAALELAREDLAQRPELVFLDTAGDASVAEARVDEAVGLGAVAIVGPVGQRESVAAAARAAVRNLPIALLAPADGADAGAGVFRLVQSPADEARRAARLAADAGYLTVGVLAPRDDTGREQTDAFVAAATALGLTVGAVGAYEPGAGELERDLKLFLGLDPKTNARLRKHLARHGTRGWKTFSPDVPFSLLFVPDQYDHAAMVASFLTYLRVEMQTSLTTDPTTLATKHGGRVPQLVQLVGDSGWNHPSLPIRGGAVLDGALMVDAFAAEDGAGFGARYQGRTRRAATSAAAQAYDGMHLVLAAWGVARTSATPRVAFATALRGAALEDGACGAARVGVDGELTRDGSVLEVSGDAIVVSPW